jgi:hypothetical protein
MRELQVPRFLAFQFARRVPAPWPSRPAGVVVEPGVRGRRGPSGHQSGSPRGGRGAGMAPSWSGPRLTRRGTPVHGRCRPACAPIK